MTSDQSTSSRGGSLSLPKEERDCRCHFKLWADLKAASPCTLIAEYMWLPCLRRRDESGNLYYTMEFTVSAPSFFRHNLSVYAVRFA
jgi:hypothetical protein